MIVLDRAIETIDLVMIVLDVVIGMMLVVLDMAVERIMVISYMVIEMVDRSLNIVLVLEEIVAVRISPTLQLVSHQQYQGIQIWTEITTIRSEYNHA